MRQKFRTKPRTAQAQHSTAQHSTAQHRLKLCKKHNNGDYLKWFKLFIYVTTLMLISTTQTKANRPAMKPAVEITYLQISGTAKAGDTFNLVVRYKAKTTGNLQMRFNFPDSVAPLNRATNETSRTDTVTVNVADSVYERTYQVKAYGVGKSLVEIEITHLAPPQGMHPKTMKDLGIIHKSATYSTLDPRDVVPDTMQVIKGTNRTKEKGKDKTQSTTRTFNISGKVTYQDEANQTNRGVYGVRVRVYFYSSYPNHQLYIPSDIDLPEATCDDEGNYSLSFSTSDELVSDFPFIKVFVANYNDAAILPPNIYTWVIDFLNIEDAPKWVSLAQSSVSYNGSTDFTATKDFALNKNDGAALRYAQMSREFALSKVNVSLPVISFTVKPLEEGLAGWFRIPSGADPYILISPDYVDDIITIPHEYGHYHNYQFWGGNLGRNNRVELVEGWATFFSFAVANYIEVTYGDKMPKLTTDNCEIGGHFIPKFKNIAYSETLHNVTDQTITPEQRAESRNICAFACYLWNLYDGYNDMQDGLQVISEYDKNDNDDVNGLGGRVFELMHKLITSTPANYHSLFKSGGWNTPNGQAPALPDTLGDAVDRIYNFMFDPSLDNTNKSMSSAQIKNLTGTKVNSNSYQLDWQNQVYNTTENYANFPTDIKVWEAHSVAVVNNVDVYGDWVEVRNLTQYTNTTTTVAAHWINNGVSGSKAAFKVSTYNSKALLPNKQCSYDAKIYVVPQGVAKKKEKEQTISLQNEISCQEGLLSKLNLLNTESKVIKISSDSVSGFFTCSIWKNDELIGTRQLWYIKIGSNYEVIKHHRIGKLFDSLYRPLTMKSNQSKTKMLYVLSKYWNTSIGSLYEMDLSNYSLRKIIDSTENVSSAVYVGSSNDEIVYYSLGNPEGVNAGYYKYNIATGSKELVLSYYSELGKEETINGFDISPDGKTMLIPVVKNYTAPVIVSYDLENKKIIGTVWSFQERNRDLLWLRYNNNGTKILYSNYGQRAFSIGPSDVAEVGIIDFRSNTKKTFSIKPEDETWDRWTAPCPNWSPDCKHIVYGMAMIANKSGTIGKYHLYVKTNVDEGTSGVSEQPEWKLARMFLW